MDTIPIKTMEERVLILCAAKRDFELSKMILNQNRIAVKCCADVSQLCQEIKIGAGAVLVGAETLDRDGIASLQRTLAEEPTWSHLPFVILLQPGELSDASQRSFDLFVPIKNTTFLERPVRVITLVGVLKGALGDRARQYEMRKLVLELEQSNSALAQFASVASHDMQEPLRTIATYLQLLEREYHPLLNQEGQQYLGFVVDGARRMQKLIADLLSYSQVGADKLNISEVNSGELVDQVLNYIQVAVKASGAKIEKKGFFPRIQADEVKLARLFQNLLSNALKFRRPGVEPVIEIGSGETDSEYVFWVADNGIGIEKRDVPRVFKIFQRLHSQDKYPGSGIGLATCQKIVERHDGSITVDSRPGEGTRFSIHFPRHRLEVPPQPRASAG